MSPFCIYMTRMPLFLINMKNKTIFFIFPRKFCIIGKQKMK
ncbi:hypothetical protein HMPREF3219_0200831 [Streptococcus salivarius]|nr:hypothetical protein HMPREF3219_0200831 [Streptococcus salivarius]